MRFDFRTFILGGEIMEKGRASNDSRKYTRAIPTADAVLTPHQPGDLIAGWAMAMCMRDRLAMIETSFPGFTFTDRLTARGVSKAFTYDSPLPDLDWWEDRLESLIAMEKLQVETQYVAVALEQEYAMAMIGAVDWFINRHRCRPPGVGEGLHQFQKQLQDATQAVDPKANLKGDLPAIGIENLEAGDQLAVAALRIFEESSFAFLGQMGAAVQREEVRRSQQNLKNAEALGLRTESATDEVDEAAFGCVKVARAIAPDGYRDEDRLGLDRFKRYVALAAAHVPPLKTRWLDKDYLALGHNLFAFGALLFSSSFPNAESAKLREEELEAARAKAEREAVEEQQRQRRGGQF